MEFDRCHKTVSDSSAGHPISSRSPQPARYSTVSAQTGLGPPMSAEHARGFSTPHRPTQPACGPGPPPGAAPMPVRGSPPHSGFGSGRFNGQPLMQRHTTCSASAVPRRRVGGSDSSGLRRGRGQRRNCQADCSASRAFSERGQGARPPRGRRPGTRSSLRSVPVRPTSTEPSGETKPSLTTWSNRRCGRRAAARLGLGRGGRAGRADRPRRRLPPHPPRRLPRPAQDQTARRSSP